MPPKVAALTGRAVLRVGGADARPFLDRLVTVDLDRLTGGAAAFGALLTPQGKILADFLLVPDGEAILLDAPAAAGPDLLKRLTLYRLRAAVTLADVSAEIAVLALWDGAAAAPAAGVAVRDPRHPGLGARLYLPRAEADAVLAGAGVASAEDYAAHRAGLGVVESGADYAPSEIFPHDAALDQIGAVDFDKGCYVGQEVVSRMQHRGTARRRPVVVRADGALPAPGTPLTAADRPIGTLGTAAGPTGVAVVRLDRAKAAMDAGTPILAAGVPVTLTLPDYVTTGWPAGPAEDG